MTKEEFIESVKNIPEDFFDLEKISDGFHTFRELMFISQKGILMESYALVVDGL